jgi:exonuclease VII large subunit
LNNFADKLSLADPKLRLKQGYSITLKNKKIIKSNSQVFPGDKITTLVFDGQFVSLIDEVK